MNFGLGGNGIFILLGGLEAILGYRTVLKLKSLFKKREKFFRILGLIVFVSLILSLVVALLVKFIFPGEKLPASLWLMIAPLCFSICSALFLILTNHRTYAVSSIAFLLSTIFTALALLNGHYKYYPDFYSLAGIQPKEISKFQQTTTQTNSLSQKNRVGVINHESIEKQLYKDTTLTNGKIISVDIPGTISKFSERSGYAYVPAAAKDKTKINLPVIILMAGFPGETQDWLIGGKLEQTMNNFARQHHGITPYVFIVDNIGKKQLDTECVDSQYGNVETYLSVDVPKFIKSNFEVASDPSQWAIGGLSLGGTCGLLMTLKHNDIFHYFLDFSGESNIEIGNKIKTVKDLFDGDENKWQASQPNLILQNKKFQDTGGYFTVGKSDKPRLISGIRNSYDLAKSVDFEVVFEQISGEHTFDVWSQSLIDALPWISEQLGATEN